MNILRPIKIQELKAGARVATGRGVLRRRGPSGSRNEIVYKFIKLSHCRSCPSEDKIFPAML